MFHIQPRKIEAIGADQYTVEFLRVKDGTSVVYTFTFSDNPRGISDYDKEFYFDTQHNPAEIWCITWALLSFDKARELGVETSDQSAAKLVPASLSVTEDTSDSSSYNIVFDTENGQRDFTV
ncbi:MAG: hypothetical protein K2Z81_05940, partial [Cyanobacteria bacterium]|nr:hypothetical protein [Cyanobacteriota bacterium]